MTRSFSGSGGTRIVTRRLRVRSSPGKVARLIIHLSLSASLLFPFFSLFLQSSSDRASESVGRSTEFHHPLPSFSPGSTTTTTTGRRRDYAYPAKHEKQPRHEVVFPVWQTSLAMLRISWWHTCLYQSEKIQIAQYLKYTIRVID